MPPRCAARGLRMQRGVEHLACTQRAGSHARAPDLRPAAARLRFPSAIRLPGCASGPFAVPRRASRTAAPGAASRLPSRHRMFSVLTESSGYMVREDVRSRSGSMVGASPRAHDRRHGGRHCVRPAPAMRSPAAWTTGIAVRYLMSGVSSSNCPTSSTEVEPDTWLTSTLEKIAAGHPQSRIHRTAALGIRPRVKRKSRWATRTACDELPGLDRRQMG